MRQGFKISRVNHRRTVTATKCWMRLAIVVLLLLAVVIISYWIYTRLNQSNIIKIQGANFNNNGISTTPITPSAIDNYKVPATHPRLLIIPSLQINARVSSLGALPPHNGGQQLDAPKNIYDVGWYDCTINPIAANRCATPKLPNDHNTTAAGLIDGHSCEGYPMTCVFNNLARLQKGATITLQLGDASNINYVVQEVDTASLNQVDMNKMLKPIVSGRNGLNLITCAGDWTTKDSRGRATMNQRVEVYAIQQ
ncbi:MAG: class F sortase [Candidatus Nanoperiomorbaceae bacterium]